MDLALNNLQSLMFGQMYSLPCYIKKKGKYRNEDEKILMSFKKFNDCQKDSPCAVCHMNRGKWLQILEQELSI